MTDLTGKTCLITGATAGLGKETARQLAALGARVILVGRDAVRLERAQAETGAACVLRADLAMQSEVRRLAAEFTVRFPRLDVLVNNVGGTFFHYEETRDGIEQTWALNYLNHFLLTRLLLGSLEAAGRARGEARILELTSPVYAFSPRDFAHRQGARFYNGVLAYAHTKRAVVVFARELARRLHGSPVSINAVSPGIVATQIARKNVWYVDLGLDLLRVVTHPLGEGVGPVVHLASSPSLKGVSGQHFERYRLLRSPSTAGAEVGRSLWQLSEAQLIK